MFCCVDQCLDVFGKVRVVIVVVYGLMSGVSVVRFVKFLVALLSSRRNF